MKPKRKKSRSLDKNRIQNPKGLTDAEYHVLRLQDYLRTRALFRDVGGPKGSTSGGRSPLKSFGPQKGHSKARAAEAKRRRGRRQPVRRQQVLSERRSGVMTNHSKQVFGQRSTTVLNGSSSITTFQSILSYQKILSGVSSTDGNHKTPNPHSYQVQRINYGSGTTVSGIYPNQVIISGAAAVGFALSAVWTDASNEVFNRALSRLTDRIRGDIDLSVDAFQARQGGIMVGLRVKQARSALVKNVPQAVQALGGLVSTFRRSHPRDWGKLWLEWTYGWKPLAQSIYGATDQLMNSAMPGGSGRKLSVRTSAGQVTDRKKTRQNIANGQYIDTWIEGLFQCRIHASYVMSNGGVQSVANYTSLNPVSIAWELVPYSFVFDWMVDVGGYLRNLETSLLYSNSFVGGYSQRRRYLNVTQAAAGGNQNGYVSATGSAEIRNFARVVFGSNPSPRAPSFNLKLGVSRATSGISLLLQQLRGVQKKHVVKSGLPGHNEANWDLFRHS